MTSCVKGCSNQSRLNKNACYNKVLREEIKFFKKDYKFFSKSNTIAIGKVFVKNRIKNRKYFSAQQYQYFRKFRRYTSAIEQNRFIQRNKKNVPRRDILRILVSVIGRFNVKRCPLIFKISPPVYLNIIKIDIMQWTTTCVNLSQSTTLSQQYFTLLEQFLLTISKKYILTRSTNLCSRNHSMLYF